MRRKSDEAAAKLQAGVAKVGKVVHKAQVALDKAVPKRDNVNGLIAISNIANKAAALRQEIPACERVELDDAMAEVQPLVDLTLAAAIAVTTLRGTAATAPPPPPLPTYQDCNEEGKSCWNKGQEEATQDHEATPAGGD